MPATAEYLAEHPFASPDIVNPPEAPTYRYRPDLTSTDDLAGVETVDLSAGSRIDLVIDDVLESFVLQAGPPTGSELEVVPDDYDFTLNQQFWLQVSVKTFTPGSVSFEDISGTLDISQLPAGSVATVDTIGEDAVYFFTDSTSLPSLKGAVDIVAFLSGVINFTDLAGTLAIEQLPAGSVASLDSIDEDGFYFFDNDTFLPLLIGKDTALAFLLPDQTGNDGKVLQTNAGVLSLATATGCSIATTPNILQGDNAGAAVATDLNDTLVGDLNYSYVSNNPTSFNVANLSTGTLAGAGISITTGSTGEVEMALGVDSPSHNTVGLEIASDSWIFTTGRLLFEVTGATVFSNDGGTTERARFTTGLSIGSTTDAGAGNILLNGLTASRFVETDGSKILVSKTAAEMRTDLGLVIGTDVQAFDSDLSTLAGLTATTDNFIISVSSTWASRTPAQARTTLGLVIGTNIQAWDADLDTIAGLTPTTNNFIVSVSSAWASRTPTQVKSTLAIANTDVSGLGTASTLASDTDGTLATNSDARIATQKAVKTYVDGINTALVAAIAALDSKDEVAYCSTSALPTCTYANGSSGVGATLTATTNGPLIIDSATIVAGAVGLGVLVAGQASDFQNGWYTITQQGVVAVSPWILTRRTPDDQAAEIGPGYLTAVEAPTGLTAGSANNQKVFLSIAPTPFVVGTDSLTFALVGGTYTAGNGLSLSGTAFSINTSITADLSTSQSLSNKTFVAPILGTPTSGTLTNCTGLPIAGLTASTSTALGVGSIELGHASDTTLARVSAGVVSIEGVTIDTISAANTLTNKTLTSPTLTTPVLGTPTSGTLTNCTFPTLNQNTTGSAASLSVSGQTGLLTVTGLASTNRAKTVRDAADTILELGGSYTPTGTWTSLTMVTPALGAATGTSLVLSSFLNEAKGADIASATTTDIGAATGNYVVVTGTVTITGLGTVQAGTRRIVKFSGALTLTHNATSLILPGSANITTVAGDTAMFISLGSGNWICVNYEQVTWTGSCSLVLATSPTFVTPLLGTPTSGNLANCTFPTLNQNTTGSAASLSISGQTGLLT